MNHIRNTVFPGEVNRFLHLYLQMHSLGSGLTCVYIRVLQALQTIRIDGIRRADCCLGSCVMDNIADGDLVPHAMCISVELVVKRAYLVVVRNLLSFAAAVVILFFSPSILVLCEGDCRNSCA